MSFVEIGAVAPVDGITVAQRELALAQYNAKLHGILTQLDKLRSDLTASVAGQSARNLVIPVVGLAATASQVTRWKAAADGIAAARTSLSNQLIPAMLNAGRDLSIPFSRVNDFVASIERMLNEQIVGWRKVVNTDSLEALIKEAKNVALKQFPPTKDVFPWALLASAVAVAYVVRSFR